MVKNTQLILALATLAVAAACAATDSEKRASAGGGGEGASGGGAVDGKGGASTSKGGRGANGGSGTPSDGGAENNGDAGDASGGASGGAMGQIECDLGCPKPTPICEDGVCVACASGALRCGDNQTPEVCVEGQWVPGTSCAADGKICSSGECVGKYLVGGLVGVGSTLGATSMKLMEHGFEATQPMVCKSNVCLSGGIRP